MLRPARPLDAGAMAGILSGFIDETEWMPRIHSRAEEVAFADTLIDRGWTTVAIHGGRVAGFLAQAGEEIHALYLAPGARGLGIGTRLLGAAKAGNARLSLWCFQANRTAREFYRARGFHEMTRTDGTGNDEGLPDIRLVWERG
ncbi:N-acetyltransferase family protein [Pseudooceanicola sp.]|uniref:N-acetyltransferase family protein n=1 Tax=Pseudooceanicola sp. TaxID=1914328 RepID=UPI0040597A55